MRRDWFSSPVAALVAAPIALTLVSADARANSMPEVVKVVAQLAAPESAAPAASTEEVVETTTATTTDSEVAADEVAADDEIPGMEDDLVNDLDSAAPAASGDVPTPLGDDALPSLLEAQNNPYIRANTMGVETARTAGDQEYGAFLPPTVTESSDVGEREAGQEMSAILGEDAYNRRVNITTPPDTEVAEVVRLLAERANLNFIYGEGVISGRVTLNLRDVPLGVALQSLLSSQDLAIIREGDNVMRIAPRKEVRPGAIDTRTIYVKLNWVDASTLAGTLKSALGAGSAGTIQAHTDSNTLVITDSATNVALLRDLVAQLDVPEKQVMIEARMVELFLARGRQLGSQLDFYKNDLTGNSPVRLPNVNDESGDVFSREGMFVSRLIGGDATQLGFGGVMSIFGSEFNVGVALDGLENANITNTLANPRIVTLNNKEANIDIKQEIPYIESGTGVAQGAVTQTVKFKDAGIRLTVLPQITNNGYVRMNLQPEQLIVNSFVQDIPVIDRRTAETNVIVKDEDTVVLGGLRQIAATDNKVETPWLGRTPVLGWLFKSDVKRHSKNDLMLFVTPHIVKAPVMTPAENYKYTRVDAHWDLPDFFFDDSVDQREGHHRFEADMNPRNFYQRNLTLPATGTVSDFATSAETSAYGSSAVK